MGSYYNSPPNWPPPPAGWTPPPDWAPDPSWPEPPQNWQFWVASPYQQPARRTGRLWLMIGLPLALVALVIGGGVIALFVYVGNSVGPARDAASSYGHALQDHRYEEAYAMRCPERAGDHDQFLANAKSQDSTGLGVTSFKVVGVNVSSINGRESARVDLDVRLGNGSSRIQQLTMTKTGGTWHPCS